MDGLFSLGPIGQLITDPLRFLVLISAFLFGMVLHNVVQARLANRLGDSTAVTYGFASTDPQRHFDLFGLIWYLVVAFCLPKTIPLKGSRLSRRGWSEVWVWLSGPLTLWIWAFLMLFLDRIFNFFLPEIQVSNVIQMGLQAAAFSLIYHGVIFLIPLPGLDGGNALYAVGNFKTRQVLDRIIAAGPLVLFICFLALSMSGLLSLLATPIFSGMQRLLSILPL